MKRLYFLVQDVEIAEQVSAALHTQGVTDRNFHAIARDASGLYRHHLHTATPYQSRDFVHTGLHWAMVGGAAGLLLGVCAEAVQLLPMPIDYTSVALFTAVCAGFGGWIGGLVGLSRENYKLAPFHDALMHGATLLMVDVPKAQADEMRSFVRERFPQVSFEGTDSPLINPFERPREVHAPLMH